MTTAAKKTPNPARSKNPAKKAAAQKTAVVEPTDLEVTSVEAFKSRKRGRIMPLPSGVVVRIERVGVEQFILQGNVPNPLMELVSDALDKGRKMDVVKMSGIEDGEVDVDMIRDMYEVVDAVVCEAILEPKIHPMPAEGEDKDDSKVYINEVDPEDKMFIFQWLTGGTDDIATFRQEALASLDALAEGQGNRPAAKRTGGPRPKKS